MASNFFLSLDGIKGESTADSYAGCIELHSMHFGAVQMSAGTRSSQGAANKGRSDWQDINVTFSLDKCTPELLKRLSLGTVMATGKIDYCVDANGGKPVWVYDMTDVQITQCMVSAVEHGGLPTVQLAMQVNKTSKFSTFEIKPDGTSAVAKIVQFNHETHVAS